MKKSEKNTIAYICSRDLFGIETAFPFPLPAKVWHDLETAKAQIHCLDECDIIKIRIEKVRKVKV
jgi:hypothetical protein